jgi:glycosyltransferase involved in cell wall biosynthesis
VNVALLLETDGPGGAEQVVAHLAEELASRGWAVTVLVPAAGEGWVDARLKHSAVTVEAVPLDGPLSLSATLAVAAVLRRTGAEVLHTHEFGQAMVGAVAARLAGIRHVITMHGGRYFAERWRRRLLLRLAIALSTAITAVSVPLAEELERSLHLRRGRVVRLPNGTRPASGGPNGVRESLGIPANSPLLVAVGNLYPVKGHRHLLSALALLGDRSPPVHLAIAGRGGEERTLRAQAQATALTDRVHLLGLRSDVGSLLHAADLFVHPSLAEGLPLAVLEAMFAERPIIATAVGGVPAALEEGKSGLLVPPGDPVALAQAIDRLLSDPERSGALGTRAAARARRDFSITQMADRYTALYAGATFQLRRA